MHSVFADVSLGRSTGWGGGQGQFNAIFAHYPKSLGSWAFLQIAILEVYQIINFDEGILRIFAIQQRFVVFVFLGVEICQIPWFDGCKVCLPMA